MIENQLRRRAEVAPEDRDKLATETYYERVMVPFKKPMDCAACGKSLDCAKVPGPGVRYSEVWICERCWEAERRQRRNANKTRGVFRGNPDYLVTRSWPKKDKIIETRLFC